MSQYRVFISHKDEDRATAIAVRNALGMFSGDLTFFISGENIAEGDDWRSVLHEQLRSSNLLLLLFTEPTRHWDWCLYEVGLFTSLDNQSDEPVVCMYGPDGDPPSPLLGTQGVPANVPEMTQFIKRLLTTTEITHRETPLNVNVNDDQIAQTAETICDHFSGNIQPYYACHRVFLELPVGAAESNVIPPEARVKATDSTMRIFGRVPGTETWGDLVKEQLEAEARWLDEINRVFRDACEGRVSAPTTHTFRAHDGARIFRPELYRLDTKGRTPVAAVIMFTEEVAPAKVGGSVFNRLRIAERYKTEVFDRIDALPEPLSDEGVAELLNSLRLIRDEAKTHEVFEEESVRTYFPDEAARAELLGIAEQWDASIADLRGAEEEGVNERVAGLLRDLDTVNDRYRAIVAKRYAELLEASPSLVDAD